MKIKKLIEILNKYISETQIIVYAYEFWIEKSGNLFLIEWKKDDQPRYINQQMMRYLGNVK